MPSSEARLLSDLQAQIKKKLKKWALKLTKISIKCSQQSRLQISVSAGVQIRNLCRSYFITSPSIVYSNDTDHNIVVSIWVSVYSASEICNRIT